MSEPSNNSTGSEPPAETAVAPTPARERHIGQFAAIFALGVAASIIYGVFHELVTARVCVEYLTLAYPPVLPGSAGPTVLAVFWGALASFWVGFILAAPVAMAARYGGWPKRDARSLIVPIILVLILTGAGAALAGYAGLAAARDGELVLPEPLASAVPIEKHNLFLAVGAAHGASYGLSLPAALAIVVWIIVRRRHSYHSESSPN